MKNRIKAIAIYLVELVVTIALSIKCAYGYVTMDYLSGLEIKVFDTILFYVSFLASFIAIIYINKAFKRRFKIASRCDREEAYNQSRSEKWETISKIAGYDKF